MHVLARIPRINVHTKIVSWFPHEHWDKRWGHSCPRISMDGGKVLGMRGNREIYFSIKTCWSPRARVASEVSLNHLFPRWENCSPDRGSNLPQNAQISQKFQSPELCFFPEVSPYEGPLLWATQLQMPFFQSPEIELGGKINNLLLSLNLPIISQDHETLAAACL